VKNCRYQIRPQAEADLDGHARVIARDILAAGPKLYDLAAQTYEMLAEMPYMGAIYHTTKPELTGLRCVPIKEFSRYLVFYKPANETVDIIRVFNDRMDKDGWL